MLMRLQVLVYENRQLKESSEFDGTIELGRQRDRDEGLFSRKRENNAWRWVIARRDETTVGRNQMILAPLDDGRVKVTNGSDKQPIRFLDRADLLPGAPARLTSRYCSSWALPRRCAFSAPARPRSTAWPRSPSRREAVSRRACRAW